MTKTIWFMMNNVIKKFGCLLLNITSIRDFTPGFVAVRSSKSTSAGRAEQFQACP